MATVQADTVNPPWRSRLTGPRAGYFQRKPTGPRIQNQTIRTKTRTDEGYRTVTTHYVRPRERARRDISAREFSPTNIGEKAGGSVGMLEAEFIICLALLVLLMF